MSIKRIAGLLFAVLVTSAQSSRAQQHRHSFDLVVGTYGSADSAGIFVYRFDGRSGRMRALDSVSGIENPSFVTFSPDHRFVYAVSETHQGRGGQVFAYRFDPKTGHLRLLNKRYSDGTDPCHISTDKTGRWLFVANYSSGSLSEFPIRSDGSIGPMSQHIQHHGHGPHKLRQASAHVHCVLVSPGNRHLFVADLGMDRVFAYDFNARTGRLTDGHPAYARVKAGNGPRHLVFSTDGSRLYLIQEIAGRINVFACKGDSLRTLQSLPTYPKGFRGRIWAAELMLSPDGRYLYAANRDDLNDLVVYRVHPGTGNLSEQSRIASGGATPRNFTLSPDGRFLLAGHQNGQWIREFRIRASDGTLHPDGVSLYRPHAVCLQMIPVR